MRRRPQEGPRPGTRPRRHLGAVHQERPGRPAADPLVPAAGDRRVRQPRLGDDEFLWPGGWEPDGKGRWVEAGWIAGQEAGEFLRQDAAPVGVVIGRKGRDANGGRVLDFHSFRHAYVTRWPGRGSRRSCPASWPGPRAGRSWSGTPTGSSRNCPPPWRASRRSGWDRTGPPSKPPGEGRNEPPLALGDSYSRRMAAHAARGAADSVICPFDVKENPRWTLS